MYNDTTAIKNHYQLGIYEINELFSYDDLHVSVFCAYECLSFASCVFFRRAFSFSHFVINESFTRPRKCFAGLKVGTYLSGKNIASPVPGFLAFFGIRCFVPKVPKPRSSTLSLRANDSVTVSYTHLTLPTILRV